MSNIKDTSYSHLMVDLETMGSESFASILSIGALEFDIDTGKTGRDFYTTIDLQSCIDSGLKMNASTIMWWMQQSDEARRDLTEGNPVPIKTALVEFNSFCDKDYQVWGNPASFDLGILQNAYQQLGMSIPWKFWNERCVRTLSSLAPDIKQKFNFSGTKHNALDDCYFQVGYCSATWRSLNLAK